MTVKFVPSGVEEVKIPNCPCGIEKSAFYPIEGKLVCHQCFNKYWGSKGIIKPWVKNV